MKKLLRYFLLVAAVVLVVLALVDVKKSGYTPIRQRIRENYGYELHAEEQVPREEIASIAEDSQSVCVFYDTNGHVNVYSHDGIFQYGIQVESSNHGLGWIALKDGLLYIKSTTNVIYRFRGQGLLDAVKFSTDPQKAEEHDIFLAREKEMQQASEAKDAATYYISEDGWSLLAADANGELRPVSFLPSYHSEGAYLLGAAACFTLFAALKENSSIQRRIRSLLPQ